MTTTALPLHTTRYTTRQGGVERLVSRLAVGMLRWSQRSTQRRAQRLQVTHEQMMLLREMEASRVSAGDLARLGRLG